MLSGGVNNYLVQITPTRETWQLAGETWHQIHKTIISARNLILYLVCLYHEQNNMYGKSDEQPWTRPHEYIYNSTKYTKYKYTQLKGEEIMKIISYWLGLV